jgi:prepilin-type N-terminal cleavage/methylation domain-containing protein
MRRRILGFTLIELMIVIAIIAIVAAIAIPGLLRAQISANEGNASASLRSLSSAQANFRKSQSVNQDLDGSGEYGLLNELTGASNMRTPGGLDKNALSITDMPVDMAPGESDYASKSGYFFQIFLPGDGEIIMDAAAAAPRSDGYDGTDPAVTDETVNAINAQENRWICYAWPASYRSSGIRAFVCDQAAQVYASANTDESGATSQPWFNGASGDVGDGSRPDYNSAMRTDGIDVNETDWENIKVKDSVNVEDTNHIWVPTGS